MTRKTTRRAVLSGGLGLIGAPLWANAPETSLRPLARSQDIAKVRPQSRPTSESLIANSGLTGQVGFVVADASTGEVLDAIIPDVALPPASVTKAVTALYALSALGPAYRYQTRVLAGGPIIDGVLEGPLILAGGGDPTLQTDDLAALADSFKASGLTEVRGPFQVWGGALPGVDEIDESQLDHLGYNPTISGINLNFNRVHFEWKRNGADYTITMDARSESYRPAVTVARMQIVDRRGPVYAYRDGNGADLWSVAKGALGDNGSRWLPVRYPERYAGEVFGTFARSHGIPLRTPMIADEMPTGEMLAMHESAPLNDVLKDMLKFSTNLTAEVVGLSATQAIATSRRGMRTSALQMARWCEDTAGIAPTFVDHSGLGDLSRISAGDMVSLLATPNTQDALVPLLKPIWFKDEKGRPLYDHPAKVMAKTGTLNFVSALAGYVRTAQGRDLAFAFFGADLEARENGKRLNEEQPRGAKSYNTRARRLQLKLLERWAFTGDD